jgi:rhodanese-related sulfurtransferase
MQFLILVLRTLLIFNLCCLFLAGCSDPTSKQPTDYQKVTAMLMECDATFVDVPKLNVEEIEKLPANSYILIDIREPKERHVSWIPNSISLESFKKNPEPYRNKLLIPYCTIGYRSAYQTKSFNNQGFQAKNLRGSILMWAWKQLPLVDDKGPTKKVHVYGKKWDLLPEGYIAVYE